MHDVDSSSGRNIGKETRKVKTYKRLTIFSEFFVCLDDQETTCIIGDGETPSTKLAAPFCMPPDVLSLAWSMVIVNTKR
jgi:hypothetical protein